MAQDIFGDHSAKRKNEVQRLDSGLRMFTLKRHLHKDELPFQIYQSCVTSMGARRHVTHWAGFVKIEGAPHYARCQSALMTDHREQKIV